MTIAFHKTIIRILLWHLGLLAVLMGILMPLRLIEPGSMLLGGIFMGVNFLLLSLGVSWILGPLAEKGRIKLGVAVLIVKVLLFLGLLSLLFFHSALDAISFAFGFSTLLVAIVIEATRVNMHLGT